MFDIRQASIAGQSAAFRASFHTAAPCTNASLPRTHSRRGTPPPASSRYSLAHHPASRGAALEKAPDALEPDIRVLHHPNQQVRVGGGVVVRRRERVIDDVDVRAVGRDRRRRIESPITSGLDRTRGRPRRTVAPRHGQVDMWLRDVAAHVGHHDAIGRVSTRRCPVGDVHRRRRGMSLRAPATLSISSAASLCRVENARLTDRAGDGDRVAP